MLNATPSLGRRKLSWAVFATAVLQGSWSTSVWGQRPQDLPRFAINNRADLIAVFTTPDPNGLDVRAAIVALEGRRIAGLLEDVLLDPSVAEPAREGVINVLYYTRDPALVDALLQIAKNGEGWIQVRAQETLRVFAYPQVCDYWRAFLGDGSAADRDISLAIGGLGYCGSERDVATLEEIARRSRYATTRDFARMSLDRVRRPLADRFSTAVWAAPPGTGEFTPGSAVTDAIKRAACRGPCQPGLMAPDARLVGSLR